MSDVAVVVVGVFVGWISVSIAFWALMEWRASKKRYDR